MRHPLCVMGLVVSACTPLVVAAPADAPAGTVWLDELDLSKSASHFEKRQSIKKTPIKIAGVTYKRGLGGGGRSQLLVALGGGATRFVSTVGIDDVERSNGSLAFEIWLDGRKVHDTGPVIKGEAKGVSVDLTGANDFELVVAHGGRETDWDRFGLGDAHFVLVPGATARPHAYALTPEPTAEIAPVDLSPLPRINGPAIVGGSPGRPFLYRVPATGQGPLAFAAQGLPAGLRLDAHTGIVTGEIAREGRTVVKITVRGTRGVATRKVTFVAAPSGAALVPTPPMGWNSWNVWGMAIDATKVRDAARALVSSGLAAHGYRYVNIDDGWQGGRDAQGELSPSKAFGDVRELAADVHAQGFKLGIYSSPGPETCGKRAGSYGHEAQDARAWAAWGVDLLKYDWCSYDRIAKDFSEPEVQKPYRVMQAALASVDRDVVYSLCQYGRAEVWRWGADVGGHLWRTTSDITDTWPSLEGIAFGQAGKEAHAGPGRWNDPDMLVLGHVGWGEHVRPTRLTGNEQILHMTHWSMVAAPLLIGADLTKLDDFTMALLTNDEVLAVNQDAIGKQASRRVTRDRTEVWSRPLADGTQAVAFYNRGPRRARVGVRWAELGLAGSQPVRDLWRRIDLGRVKDAFEAEVPQHGAVLIKVGKPK